MGVYAEWQPRYAGEGVATFPLIIEGATKKPATKGYGRVGLKGSEQLALKFPEIDAFAFMAGKRNNITVVDIDAPDDEDLLREVLRRYGDTPLISRTGSGGFHCYYAHSGESRKIRFDPSVPVDMIGGGVLAAPPSQGSKGAYAFIRGNVADLHRLPFIREAANSPEALQAVKRELVQEGNRNRALFEHLMRQARHVDVFDDLLDVARTFAGDQFATPMGESELVQTAKSAWGYETTGKNKFGQPATLSISHDRIDQVLPMGADPLALFIYLQRKSNHRDNLIVANDMRKTMPDGEWPLRRFTSARKALIDGGVLRETRPASTYRGPAVYAWQG